MTFPCWIRSLFLLGVSLGRILRDPFLIGIPLDFTKRGEQVISLYTWYVGGKQQFIRIISLHCPFSLNAVSFLIASAFECLVRYFLTSSSLMSIMEADGMQKRPSAHVIAIVRWLVSYCEYLLFSATSVAPYSIISSF